MPRHKNPIDPDDYFNLADLLDDLEKMNIIGLRSVGKKLGVKSPTTYPRDELLKLVAEKINGKVKRVVEDVPEIKAKPFAIDGSKLSDDDRMRLIGEADAPELNAETTVCGFFSNFEKGDDGYVSMGLTPTTADCLVIETLVSRYSLKRGDFIVGKARLYPSCGFNCLLGVDKINGIPAKKYVRRDFDLLESKTCSVPVKLWEEGVGVLRAAELVSPIRYGQRLIVSSDGAVPTYKEMSALSSALKENAEHEVLPVFFDFHPEITTGLPDNAVLVPFDAPDNIKGYATSLLSEHIRRRVEAGKNIIVVVDRVDAAARNHLGDVMRLLGSARRTEYGCATVIASILKDAMPPWDYAALRAVGDSEFVVNSTADFKLAPDYSSCWSINEVDAAAVKIRKEGTKGLDATSFVFKEDFVKAL